MSTTDETVALNSIRKQFLCKTSLKNFVWHVSQSTNLNLLLTNAVHFLGFAWSFNVTHTAIVVAKHRMLRFGSVPSFEDLLSKGIFKSVVRWVDKAERWSARWTVRSLRSLGGVGWCRCTPLQTFWIKRARNYNVTRKFRVYFGRNYRTFHLGGRQLNFYFVLFFFVQASLVLAEWCIANKSIFENKTVLELGAGVGLAGITVNLKCQPSRILLTDCHETVLALLEKNVQLYFNDDTNVRVLNLPWEVINAEKCASLGKIDVIIAADVVYDSELFHPLADAIKCLLSSSGAQETFLACTKRNQRTLNDFLAVLSRFWWPSWLLCVIVWFCRGKIFGLFYVEETATELFHLANWRWNQVVQNYLRRIRR